MAGSRSNGIPENQLPPLQEVRISLVMYGGVSLAIYINGVAQEMLRLVRATASRRRGSEDDTEPFLAGHELKPLDHIYRELGQRAGSDDPARAAVPPDARICTRFVVDVLSGTSAGGINAVFLAKALANHQSLEQLKQLWIKEGDLGVLLNDERSVEHQPDLELQKPVPSLLNGTRMYRSLVGALDGLDSTHGVDERWQSSLVDELDLYVTTTDIRGLSLPLRLADRVVWEKRHRNVFHFFYASEYASGELHNDFLSGNNPFLAFAARCTSSFPLAFEPMQLGDLRRTAPYKADDAAYRLDIESWRSFFKDYLRRAPTQRTAPRSVSESDFPRRSFGDGGYLDNKPFSYATDALRLRRADYRVVRKLFYIEPSPEHPELDYGTLGRPDAFSNLLAAGSGLPRSETIREDLERVLLRNRTIERIQRAVREIETDVHLEEAFEEAQLIETMRSSKAADGSAVTELPPKPVLSGPQWAALGLRDMIAEFGAAYGSYQRLKVGEVTTELAQLVARGAGFDQESDEMLAIRYLVSEWRQEHYQPEGKLAPKPWRAPLEPHAVNYEPQSENAFLLSYDLSYRLRRLLFLQSRIDLLFELDARALEVMNSDLQTGRMIAELRRRPELAELASPFDRPSVRDAVRDELLHLKRALSDVVRSLRVTGRTLRRRSTENPMHAEFDRLQISSCELQEVLAPHQEPERLAAARATLAKENRAAIVQEVAAALDARLKEAFVTASRAVAEILPFPNADGAPPALPADVDGAARAIVRGFLRRHYDRYDAYDMILFPLLYDTDIGEPIEVDVLRISPEDAKHLIEERDAGGRLQCRKLAGTTLGNFGGFLDPTWRRSDILWGRLDAAERIIRSTLREPNQQAIADELIGRAQRAIVTEELAPLNDLAPRVLVEALIRTSRREPDYELLARMLDVLLPLGVLVSGDWPPALTRDRITAAYRDAFETRNHPRQIDPERAVRLLARATQIMGRLLDGIALEGAKTLSGVAWWLLWAGRILWGLVEVSVPRSVVQLVFRYWLQVIYVFELLLIVGGMALGNAPIRQFGLALLFLTLFVDFTRNLFEVLLRRPQRMWRAIFVVFALLVGGVFYLGLRDAQHRLDATSERVHRYVERLVHKPRGAVRL